MAAQQNRMDSNTVDTLEAILNAFENYNSQYAIPATLMMRRCIEHLKQSANIINKKLHPNNQHAQTKAEQENVDIESTTTRRNSQYKTSALIMLYYTIYTSTEGHPPENIQFKDEEKATKDRKRKRNKNPRSTYVQITHYNTFLSRNNSYTYDMVKNVDLHMKRLVQFGIDEYYKYCGQWLAIGLVIKDKEKGDSKKKSKYEMYDTENIGDNGNEYLTPYEPHDINTLKNMSKEPGVLMKFYQAWLMECDWEVLMTEIEMRLTSVYPPAQTIRLLQYIVSIVAKAAFTSNEKQLQFEKLSSELKAGSYLNVAKMLMEWVVKCKYRRYDVKDYQVIDDKQLYDIKCYPDIARNTENMYVYATSVYMNLSTANYKNETGKVNIAYTVVEGKINQRTYFFDLISVPKPAVLELLNWKQRLEVLKKLSAGLDHTIIEVEPISHRKIQFDAYPQGSQMYYYIRTTGLGIGTLFIKKATTKNKTRHPAQPANKRYKRTTPIDLVPVNGQRHIANKEVEEEEVPTGLTSSDILKFARLTHLFNMTRAEHTQQQYSSYYPQFSLSNPLGMLSFPLMDSSPIPSPSPPPPPSYYSGGLNYRSVSAVTPKVEDFPATEPTPSDNTITTAPTTSSQKYTAQQVDSISRISNRLKTADTYNFSFQSIIDSDSNDDD
ncbi:hypothetical protein CcNV_037 [Crangon crangon nudivirus]|uniref:Uncharacterized protein n=1 Tax=Crangon crangon nudivirus TaxID=2880838 RepID=A0AAE8XZV5_9VIRU|nr:hypothetical protein QKT25_gp037 [Crangon crangon nudivirus]UBZ25521.1 hypothetical protein CcNV_037 [Crangon crangon nudivirus]